MVKMFLTGCLICFALFRVDAFAYDATPPCFRGLEATFFERVPIIQALSYTEIQQGLWENIAQELRMKTPYIHRELRRLGQLKKRNPTDYPFRMNESKDLLIGVLFHMVDQTMRENKYVMINEGDIARVFAFIRASHQKQWDFCK